jgi:predicted lipid carrier protein YhbT
MRKRNNPNAWFQQALKVTEDPAASGWLKNALIEAINRDPVDAAGDAAILSRILQQRAAAIRSDPVSGARARSTE